MKQVLWQTLTDGPRLGLIFFAVALLAQIGNLSVSRALWTLAGALAAGVVAEFFFDLVRHLRRSSVPDKAGKGKKS